MERREYLQSVGGVALTPKLSLAGTRTGGRLTPEEYKRRVPDNLRGTSILTSEETHESRGKLIYSVYLGDEIMRIVYSEERDEQLVVEGGALGYQPDSVRQACSYIRAFERDVEFEINPSYSESAIYSNYSIGEWTATSKQILTDSPTTVAVIDGERIEFEDRSKMRRTLTEEIVRRIL